MGDAQEVTVGASLENTQLDVRMNVWTDGQDMQAYLCSFLCSRLPGEWLLSGYLL